ncbi:Protein suppressor of sable [Orchesella cincta]|uniref:Protein suppressor of sable n=1 Tax=Orchesella cincta TaxID=48709 RepID=A0A1D2N560_ORCCI|nr:Protein suppressor of sable [Orchesella cincta]
MPTGRESARKTMEGDASSTIDSSSEAMDQQNSSAANNFDGGGGGGGDARVSAQQRISSSGADEESDPDELTIDDSCVNNDDNETADMDDDSDNNVAIVSSSTLHQIHEEDEEDGCVASSGYMSSEQDAVAVVSKPLHDDEGMENDEGDDDTSTSQQPIVSTTSSATVVRNPDVTTTAGQQEIESSQVEQRVAKITKGAEDDDVDIDGIEDNNPVTTTPASPVGPESPPPSEAQSICNNDSPPQSPEDETTGTPDPLVPSVPLQVGSQSPQTEAIVSQDNFSQFDTSTSNITLSTITSQSSITKTLSSQDSAARSDEDATMDEAMDTSQVETSQGGTQQSPDVSEMENDESQQSSIVAASEKSVANNANGAVSSKNRSKSRSRSNTDDGDDDIDLEDGEIMDDEEEEVKAAPPPPKEKKEKEKEKEKSIKSSSSVKERSSEKEKDKGREKDKDKEREKDKHRKDKKRSKREEEKEKEKEKDSSKKKKRKASDEAESEQEEYLFVRGASPGSAAHPLPDPWSAPVVEEFGDDSKVSRAKRRRESDGDGSPHHHHHPSRPPREPTPPGRRMDRNKRPMREERKEPKSDVICAYFMQGKCQKSAMECSFSHDAVPPRKMELCKFWMMECCAKKEKCLYLHNDFPCKYFHTGLICKAGDRCKFSHSPLSDVTKQVLLKHIETAPKEILGDFPRLNRQGAINLINKMEARARGEKSSWQGRTTPMPPHERHHHGRNDDRHSRNNRDHHGGGGHGQQQQQHQQHHGHHGHGNHNQRGGNSNNNNDARGGRGNPIDPHGQNNRNNSRWEQQQPTRDDQEKLQELMEEAGISGFYKDTLETGIPPPGSQSQGPPGQFPPMQPPLLPLNPVLMSQMLPGLLPQGQANAVNNPALANVLATLNIPTTMVPTTLASIPPMSTSQDDSNSDKSIPDHLPKMQKELFMRIQKQQQKNEKKMQNIDKSEPEEPEENWYSSEDEDESKKKEEKTEISDKISSVLNQIRQQTQPQASSSPVLPSALPLPPVSDPKPPSFYGDTDFRSQPPSFKDVDLRNPSSIFKKIDIEPAKEINASLAHNGPMSYKLRKVANVPKIDYSSIRLGLPPSSIVLDPRLGPKRNNSIPAPASPTETSAPDIGIQPLTIPDGTPVFDPRTMRGGGQGSSGPGRNVGAPGITPQQNNPFLDSDNSLPNPVNDFPSLFNRDPRGGGGGQNTGMNQPPPGNPQAQIQAMAAAMAAMQQQLPNMQGPIDPNLLMLGFPFLPQQPGGVQNPLDFQQMLAASGAATGNLRMRPPFTSQQPPSSSWERLNQGQQGQGGGDLTPPL